MTAPVDHLAYLVSESGNIFRIFLTNLAPAGSFDIDNGGNVSRRYLWIPG